LRSPICRRASATSASSRSGTTGRAENPEVPLLQLHKMTEEQARLEMSAVGLQFVRNLDGLPLQHALVFEKPPIP
jgi:hypothetical protein